VFNIRCAQLKVIPKSARVKYNFSSARERNNAKECERKIVNSRIRTFSKDIIKIQQWIKELKDSLKARLPADLFQQLTEDVFQNKEAIFMKQRAVQVSKLAKLAQVPLTVVPPTVSSGVTPDPSNDPSMSTSAPASTRTSAPASTRATELEVPDIRHKWVINKSKKELTVHERSILSKGPKYAVTPKSIPVMDYIAATSVAGLQAGESSGVDTSGMYHEVGKLLTHYNSKPIKQNISGNE
jgi:hypothetical protein